MRPNNIQSFLRDVRGKLNSIALVSSTPLLKPFKATPAFRTNILTRFLATKLLVIRHDIRAGSQNRFIEDR
jgi:hypothetical protein